MKSSWIAASLVALGACSTTPSAELRGPVHEWANGQWYTGSGFQLKTMYSVGGVLRTEPVGRVDSVIDLSGRYVVPPFGEAHTHRPADPARSALDNRFFLEAGIFYVMNHGGLASYRDALDTLVNRPGSVDVRFANALVASPQSHGVDLWQRLVGRGAFPGVEVEGLDGDAYVVVESLNDLRRQWPRLLATRPEFIKIMVEYSEEYEARRDDPQYFGRSGLDPALVPEIVSRAHDAGLRVSAHIETATDFSVVIAAGVDMVAHLPGYDIPEDDDVDRYRILPSDAALAAARGIVVVTTTLLSVDRADGDAARLRRMLDNHRNNLQLLAEAGVSLAVGSDQFSQHAVDEAVHLASLDVLSAAALLDMLCRITPRAIFPERRVGVLEDGAEASFLVLSENPLEHFDHVRHIALRVKDGMAIGSL